MPTDSRKSLALPWMQCQHPSTTIPKPAQRSTTNAYETEHRHGNLLPTPSRAARGQNRYPNTRGHRTLPKPHWTSSSTIPNRMGAAFVWQDIRLVGPLPRRHQQRPHKWNYLLLSNNPQNMEVHNWLVDQPQRRPPPATSRPWQTCPSGSGPESTPHRQPRPSITSHDKCHYRSQHTQQIHSTTTSMDWDRLTSHTTPPCRCPTKGNSTHPGYQIVLPNPQYLSPAKL